MISKIITPQEKEKKDRRNKIIIGVILVALMLLSTAGYALFSGGKTSTNKIEYNGITFYKTANGWTTTLNGNRHDFQYLPGEVGSIKVPAEIFLNNYYNKPVFLVSDYQDANYELAVNLEKYTERINRACISENCSDDLPIKTCNDTVIEIREVNATSILAEDNCVFIYSDNPIKAVDAFLYKILGI